MIVYEFYFWDEMEDVHFIGVLPERREEPLRITKESIINWGRIFLGDNSGVDFNKIYFNQIEV